MASDKDDDSAAQKLTTQLEQLRNDLHKIIDNAIIEIARTCVGMSDVAREKVVASVFNQITGNMATATTTMVAAQPSPKTAGVISDAAPRERKKPGRKPNYENSSAAALRNLYYKRIRAGKEIEPELEAALIKNFTTYDAATHKFIGNTQTARSAIAETGERRKPGRKPNWETASDKSLRRTHYKRIRNGKKIEPELEAILIKRFPTIYNATTHKFIGNRKPGKTDTTARPYKDLSTNDVVMKYHTAKQNGEPIDDILNAELKRRIKRYDAEKRILPEFARRHGRMRKPLRELSDSTIKQMYYKVRGKGISPELNTELSRRFPQYNRKTKTFVDLRGGYRIATAKDIAEQGRKETAQPAPIVKTTPAPTTVTQEPIKQSFDLVVSKQLIKLSPDGALYDVFVNGKRILRNHIDTEIKLFLNGTILAVHGRTTNIKEIPDVPAWQIYNTDLVRRTFDYAQPLNKKSTYIKNVAKLGDKQIILEVSNKMRVILGEKKTLKIFKIASENQK